MCSIFGHPSYSVFNMSYSCKILQDFSHMKVTFLHPDLGIGGAERLVVSERHSRTTFVKALSLVGCCIGFARRGTRSQFCHKLLLSGPLLLRFAHVQRYLALDPVPIVPAISTISDIKVVGGFPRSFLGRCVALCAYMRICFAAIYICLNEDPDVIFCDMVQHTLQRHYVHHCH